MSNSVGSPLWTRQVFTRPTGWRQRSPDDGRGLSRCHRAGCIPGRDRTHEFSGTAAFCGSEESVFLASVPERRDRPCDLCWPDQALLDEWAKRILLFGDRAREVSAGSKVEILGRDSRVTVVDILRLYLAKHTIRTYFSERCTCVRCQETGSLKFRRDVADLATLGILSATLPLPDYGRVASNRGGRRNSRVFRLLPTTNVVRQTLGVR